uniref:SPARC related modular calcium binding 2 n=1 Tax=Macaca mulatta TaxID=9544 RepID=A0A1D5RA35_MACMU
MRVCECARGEGGTETAPTGHHAALVAPTPPLAPQTRARAASGPERARGSGRWEVGLGEEREREGGGREGRIREAPGYLTGPRADAKDAEDLWVPAGELLQQGLRELWGEHRGAAPPRACRAAIALGALLVAVPGRRARLISRPRHLRHHAAPPALLAAAARGAAPAGARAEVLGAHGSINEKLPQREGTGKTDDAVAPALETQPQGDEEDIASRYPTLWTEQVKSRQNKTNKNSVSSCDQEHQSALEEAKQPKNDNVVIPECAHGGLYKPVQCHPSTGYCWCVLVDTGRPIPGTSTRYEQPKCDNTARAHPAKARDLYKGRQLQGCPGAKKHEFLTSILDALSTDMVHAVSDPSSSSGRLSEPDPSHTLEERVVHWYFKLLDKNSSGDIGKKEIKPFKRFLRKKSKPKKCVKKFVEYCDVNNDKSISVQELMGCLGVAKEDGKADTKKRHTPRGNAESTSNRQPRKQG